MTKRSTKSSLLLSVLALLVCASMLVGTTFAWFTDSVTSANNKIQSGTLKIDLKLFNEQTGVYESIKDSKAPIFDYDLWEPGYTEVNLLQVENLGTLALKWKAKFVSQFAISKLAEVIDVYVCPSATALTMPGRDLAGYTNVGTLDQFINTIEETTYGTLKANESAYLGIALKMQETAGNEYQNLALAEGGFDIQILATQLNHEHDSFDENYDMGLDPIGEDETLKVDNGIQYVFDSSANNTLYLVTDDYTDDTVVVAEGTTALGNYSFSYNSYVKEVILPSSIETLGRAFDSSTVEKVVLNEGLEQIDSRAFKSTTALEEVVISSTVKEICDNAFQKSYIESITIPATVETIGEAAFGASKIETVTIEGNTSIQGYAFRGCPELTTVYLNGDDVTFIASTLNNRNSTWFCNGESNNQNTSNITFHVKNETVAQRVKTAMGAEAGNTPVYVNGVLYTGA